MPATALILALSGAFVHAAWNLALAGEPDVHAATAVAVLAGVVLLAPVALADWRFEAAAWPYVAASAALELLYLALLATAYARAAAGFVYPTARGAAPVFVLLIGVLALGQDVSGARRGGRGDGRGGDRPRPRAERAARRGWTSRWRSPSAAASRATRWSTRRASATPPRRRTCSWSSRSPAPATSPGRGGRAAARPSAGPCPSRTVLAGAGFFIAYGLTLAALKEAPAAAVAAVRETSVVIAVAWLALSGRERVTGWRAGGAVAVACGVALISAAGAA